MLPAIAQRIKDIETEKQREEAEKKQTEEAKAKAEKEAKEKEEREKAGKNKEQLRGIVQAIGGLGNKIQYLNGYRRVEEAGEVSFIKGEEILTDIQVT